jgi:hypothetical protein
MSEPQYVKIAAPVKWSSLFIDRFYVGQNVYEISTKGALQTDYRTGMPQCRPGTMK